MRILYRPFATPRLSGVMPFVRRHERWGLAVLLGLALLVRLPYLSLEADKFGDLYTYRHWMMNLSYHGLTRIYDTNKVDYPPLLLYVLYAASWIMPHLPHTGLSHTAMMNVMIKFPIAVADVLTTWLIVWSLRRQAAGIRWGVGALYAFNPAIWYLSSIWGQTDAVYTLFLVATVIALARNALLPAWIIYTLALGTKAQSLFFAPLLVVVTLTGWGARGLARGIGASTITFMLLTAPWLLSGRIGEVLARYTLPDTKIRLDVSAYNLWYLLRLGQVAWVTGTGHPLGLPLSYRELLVALYGGFALLIVGLVWADPRRSWALAAALLNLGMFMLLPQMHERYMFPTLAFMLLAAAGAAAAEGTDRQPAVGTTSLWWVYGLLSITFLVNLVTVNLFATAWKSNPMMALPHSMRDEILKGMALTAAFVNTIVFLWLTRAFFAPLLRAARADGEVPNSQPPNAAL